MPKNLVAPAAMPFQTLKNLAACAAVPSPTLENLAAPAAMPFPTLNNLAAHAAVPFPTLENLVAHAAVPFPTLENLAALRAKCPPFSGLEAAKSARSGRNNPTPHFFFPTPPGRISASPRPWLPTKSQDPLKPFLPLPETWPEEQSPKAGRPRAEHPCHHPRRHGLTVVD
ncbi:MAG: hypothetical protein J0M04_13165 [Verrucomicrobia bacterium]|nr:hypothetical protein [Verrucomicrobiota bacterium]